MKKIKINKLMFKIGNRITSVIENLFSPIKVFPYTVSALTYDIKTRRKRFTKIFIDEVFYYGVMSLPIVVILGAIIGILIIVLFPYDTLSFGIDNINGYLYSTIIVRELTPSLTTFVIMIRSTISITIQLTQMKINDEIETLELLGINPIQYLGSIKIFAAIASLPVLTIYFAISALFGAMITAYIVHNIPIFTFMKDIYNYISFKDIFLSIFKTLVSGIIIFIIAIYHGLTAEKGQNVIISRTIKAITLSIVIVLIFNIFITVSIYAGK